MGFNTLLPLLIISTIYGFFTYLNLRIVGIDLRGLELAIFEVDLTQTGCEGVLSSVRLCLGVMFVRIGCNP